VRARASADVETASAPAPPAPFAGFVAPEVREEIIVKMPSPGDLDGIDEREWVPQSDTVSFRPLLLCVSQGYYVNLLRVRGGGVLSRHRHPGPVHGFCLKGSWRYLEHDWVAEQGSYVFEPPGETHTLVVDPGVPEMVTLFNVSGALLYCDENGDVTRAEDVFDKLAMAKAHYERVGLGAGYVDKFVR
jgi:quercetin dioxygenase-like cupin family protein